MRSHKMLALHITAVYPYPALECPPASRFSAGNRIHHFPWLDARFWPYTVSCDILLAQAGWASFFWCSMTRCLCRWQELSPNPCFSSPDKQTHCMYHIHLQNNTSLIIGLYYEASSTYPGYLWVNLTIVTLVYSVKGWIGRYLLKIDVAAKTKQNIFYVKI